MNGREGASLSSPRSTGTYVTSSPVGLLGSSDIESMYRNLDLSLPTSQAHPTGDTASIDRGGDATSYANSYHDNLGPSVPRDDSGMSLASIGRGRTSERPSDSGYGTDSPGCLNTNNTLRFNFSGFGSPHEYESNLHLQGSPNEYDELDFDLDINPEEDDDVFLDVVPEEEVDGDDGEPAFPRVPISSHDVMDGATWRRGGGSEGQAESSTEEEEGLSSSRSAPISIPRNLSTEDALYALTLAYTPQHQQEARSMALSPGGALYFASASVRDHRGMWSVTGAHMHCPLISNARNPLTVRRAAFLTSSPCRIPIQISNCPQSNGGWKLKQGIQYEELPRRRHSDGIDPTDSSGEVATQGSAHAPTPILNPRGSVYGHRMRPRPLPRPQSESDIQLERRLGQELRRISDEFHMSYQQVSVTRLRRASQPNSVQLSNSFPERRGSVIERLGELLGLLPRHGEGVEDEIRDEMRSSFVPRRRAHSEIVMASGISTSCFGRMDSVITDSERSGGESDSTPDHLSDDNEEGSHATFTLSVEES